MMELRTDYYSKEEGDFKEKKIDSPTSSIMDLSNVVPGEIEIEDEIKMGYLRMKYKKVSK